MNIFNIFRSNNKKFSINRGEGKTIVLSDYKWVYVEEYKLTSDLQGEKNEFLKNLRNKEFYFEDVHWSGIDEKTSIKRFHGPYPIEEVLQENYKEVNFSKAHELLNQTLNNPDFHKGFPFEHEFHVEAGELLMKTFADKDEILWLDKKFDINRLGYWGRYGFWAEFLARSQSKLIYLTIGED